MELKKENLKKKIDYKKLSKNFLNPRRKES